MAKTGKTIITFIYGIGALIAFVLLALVLSQSHMVLFPNAMLAMELHELAGTWLALGFIPMLVFSILFYKVHDISQSNQKKRNAIFVFIPAVVCLSYFVFWVGVWVIAIIKMVVNMAK